MMDLLDAICRGNLERLQAVLALGANPNEPDEHWRTPLMRAAEWDRPESVAPLLAAGARLEAKDDRGQTALLMAVGAANARMVQALLDGGADLKARDAHFETPLTIALSCPMGFEERSRETTRLVAAALDEATVAFELRRRIERQQAELLSQQNTTVQSVKELVAVLEERGVAALDADERTELQKILESAQAFAAEATELRDDGARLIERIAAGPRRVVDDAFTYGQAHRALLMRAMFVRMSITTFQHAFESWPAPPAPTSAPEPR